MTYIIIWKSGDTTKKTFENKSERDEYIRINSFLRRKDGIVKMIKC